jgi:hypothetical protein
MTLAELLGRYNGSVRLYSRLRPNSPRRVAAAGRLNWKSMRTHIDFRHIVGVAGKAHFFPC